jgi:uncharacterized iron-regulated membrane protein
MSPTMSLRRRTLSLGALALCFCAVASSPAAAQKAAASHTGLNVEGSKKLLGEAKITPDSAAAIAVAKVPGTTASSAKIERKGKALVYTVSLLKAGSKDVDRVWVDGSTGTVMCTQHYGGVSGKMRHAHQAHEQKEAKKG